MPKDDATRFHAPDLAAPAARGGWFGRLRAVRENMLALVPEASSHTPIVSRRLGPVRWHIVSGPDAFRRVFRDNVANYPKAAMMHRLLGPYLGRGLLLAEGDDWAWQRRALGTAFRRDKLALMAPAMLRVAEATAERVLAKGHDGTVQFSAEMRRTAMEMVRDTMFTDLAAALGRVKGTAPDPTRLDRYKETLQDDLESFLHAFGKPSLMDLLNLPPWLRDPLKARRGDPLAGPRALVERLIAERRARGERINDLLDIMLHARDPEDGRRMTDAELADNLVTFIVAGSDTTALALTWAVYAMTRAPGIARRLRDEADAAFAASSCATKILARLPYARQVLDETLRLFPPAPLLIRTARGADAICGTSIRRGDVILAPIWTLHRSPLAWHDPDIFDPERFAGPPACDRFAYLPFGAGPRICIGPAFAMMEAQLTLAALVRRIDFRLEDGWTVHPRMLLTLKPDGGLPVRATPRRAGVMVGGERLELPTSSV